MPANRRYRTSNYLLVMHSSSKLIRLLQFTLTLWNPTIHPETHLMRVPVTGDYTIRDPTGQFITAEAIKMLETD